jgi:hypothetical protein
MEQDISVFDKAVLTLTKSLVPDPGADNHVPITNGSAITTPNFLAGSQAGQEQVVIGTGDQSIKVEKTQNTTIVEKRVTDVGKDETYTNKEKYDRSVLGEYGHIEGKNELELRVDKNYIKITKSEIRISFGEEKKVITLNAQGITLTVDGDKIITMDKDSISSSVGRKKTITIDGEGIFSWIDGGKSMIAMDAKGIKSSVRGSNYTRVHEGGVDTKGTLVKINDPGEDEE